MAGVRAIHGVSESLISLLETVYTSSPPAGFPPNPDFAIYLASQFKDADHMKEGISLFLYRVYVNTSQRSSRRRDPATGKDLLPPIPLELHFFLTVWARTASVQHDLLGWMMRAVDDYAILPPALLNRVDGAGFADDETVEIVPGQLTNEELMRIWDDLHADYQLSVPYVARVVRIESELEVGEGPPVVVREFALGTPVG